MSKRVKHALHDIILTYILFVFKFTQNNILNAVSKKTFFRICCNLIKYIFNIIRNI